METHFLEKYVKFGVNVNTWNYKIFMLFCNFSIWDQFSTIFRLTSIERAFKWAHEIKSRIIWPRVLEENTLKKNTYWLGLDTKCKFCSKSVPFIDLLLKNMWVEWRNSFFFLYSLPYLLQFFKEILSKMISNLTWTNVGFKIL